MNQAPPSGFTTISPKFPAVNCEKSPAAKEFANHVLSELENFTPDQLNVVISKIRANLGEDEMRKVELRCDIEMSRNGDPFTLQSFNYDDPHVRNQLFVKTACDRILKLTKRKLAAPKPEDGLDGLVTIFGTPLPLEEKLSRASEIFTALQVKCIDSFGLRSI